MAAELPPFMNAYGNIVKILEKIRVAATPSRFTQDFLGTELGFTGGSATPFIPFAKRIGLIGSDGAPTDLYKRFRNQAQSGYAIAEATRRGYADLYKRNEYAHSLDKKDLAGLVQEVTGLEASSKSLGAIVASFLALKSLANFSPPPATGDGVGMIKAPASGEKKTDELGVEQLGNFRLSYTITLNLPNTTDIAVFNAIFKALRENLM